MFHTRLKCAHCGNLADFGLTSAWEAIPLKEVKEDRSNRGPQVTMRTITPAMRVKAYGTASCPLCHSPVLIVFEATYDEVQQLTRSLSTDRTPNFRDITILDTHPSQPKPNKHPAYPDEIKDIFAEAQEDLAANRSPARIVATCRSVLDVCTKKLGGEGNQLSHRIDNLRASGVLTKALADWAHTVRIDGNEAIHEISATAKEAAALVEFIKLFLELAFVLPAHIAERRNRPG